MKLALSLLRARTSSSPLPTRLGVLAIVWAAAGCSSGAGTLDPSPADASTTASAADAGGDTGKTTGGGGAATSIGHVAYVSGPCAPGYAKLGTMSGLTVCLSDEEGTTVMSTSSSCERGARVGDMSGPYYRSVCRFSGTLATAQFASGCPSDFKDLEPSGNGSRACGKEGVQLYWEQGADCAPGFRDAGKGLGVGHICRRDTSGTMAYISPCPSGWEGVGGYCASPDSRLLASFDQACPRGWVLLGNSGGGTVACQKG